MYKARAKVSKQLVLTCSNSQRLTVQSVPYTDQLILAVLILRFSLKQNKLITVSSAGVEILNGSVSVYSDAKEPLAESFKFWASLAED